MTKFKKILSTDVQILCCIRFLKGSGVLNGTDNWIMYKNYDWVKCK